MSHERKGPVFEVTFIQDSNWYLFRSVDNGPHMSDNTVERFNTDLQEWEVIFNQESVNSKEAIDIHYVGLQLKRELEL